jgi:hypothetical protein
VSIGSLPGVVGLAAFRNLDDGYEVVLAAEQSGNIHEYYYRPSYPQSHGEDVIAYVDGVTALSGFFAKDDTFRIAIAGDKYGNVHEIFYHPWYGIFRSVIASFPWSGVRAVSAFYHDYDHHRIVFVALDDGNIFEVNYHPLDGIRITWRMQTRDAAMALAGYSVPNPCAGAIGCPWGPSVWVLSVAEANDGSPYQWSTKLRRIQITPSTTLALSDATISGYVSSLSGDGNDLFYSDLDARYMYTPLRGWIGATFRRVGFWHDQSATFEPIGTAAARVAMGLSRPSRAWTVTGSGWDTINVPATAVCF